MAKHRKKPDAHLWRMNALSDFINRQNDARQEFKAHVPWPDRIAKFDAEQFEARDDFEKRLAEQFPI